MTPIDRVAGMIAGLAYGDALGARYEGLHWAPRPDRVRFGRGILVWRQPGWWTDDTDMALGILLALDKFPTFHDLRSDAGLRAVLEQWLRWHRRGNPLDAGQNTYFVLRRQRRARDLREAQGMSRQQLRRRRGGGNGAVMRTAPVALPYIGEPYAANEAARAVAALTHPADQATEAASVWTVLCERALATGRLDVDAALHVAGHDQPFWADRLLFPSRPGRNGPRNWAPTTVADALWCVQEAQRRTGGSPAALDLGVRLAVSSGQDPDTTAAVAGSLLGALHGASAVPVAARPRVHGGWWAGRRWTLPELEQLAVRVAVRHDPANA